MLEEVKQSYVQAAAMIPGWQTMSVNTLCNLYIKHEDDPDLKSAYFSAIMVKKWPYIGKHYANSKASGFSIEDCYDMVVHGILYALKQRKWLDPTNKLYTDKCAPDKVVNRCIASSRDIQYYLANTAKRKANFGKTSLDQIVENVKDSAEVLAEDMSEEDNTVRELNLKALIQELFDKRKFLSALIVESIINGDCFVEKIQTRTIVNEYGEEEKIKTADHSFKLGKLVNSLLMYTDDDLNNIAEIYNVNKVYLDELVNFTRKMSKISFSNVVKKTLAELNTPELREYLCC